jgi:hypothetical protein
MSSLRVVDPLGLVRPPIVSRSGYLATSVLPLLLLLAGDQRIVGQHMKHEYERRRCALGHPTIFVAVLS